MQCVEYCMKWIFEHACMAPERNCLKKVFFIEDMVIDLYDHCGASIAEAEASVLLETSNFDYEKHTRYEVYAFKNQDVNIEHRVCMMFIVYGGL